MPVLLVPGSAVDVVNMLLMLRRVRALQLHRRRRVANKHARHGETLHGYHQQQQRNNPDAEAEHL